MKATTEVEIKVGGRILGFTEVGEGTYRFVIETEVPDKKQEVTTDMQEDVFVLVEASKLSLGDEFMQYEPRKEIEKEFKELLANTIRKGVKDFYRPKYDPSFNEDETGVTFKTGEKPAVGKSYNWWVQAAKEFMPKRHSRLGTMSEYVAFLGVLIKQLVTDGWSVAKAWNAVCSDSEELGHYSDYDFEDTGSREICEFFDLANTHKILAEDEDNCAGGFWQAGGCYYCASGIAPISYLAHFTYCNYDSDVSVGWFVLEK